MKSLIVGGTGTVGSVVVEEARKRGADLRLFVRPKSEHLPPGIETATGDLLDPAAVGFALRGVRSVYLLNAVTPDELTQALVVVDLAKRAGVERFVYHSVFDVERFPDVPHFASKFAIETALRASGMPWTIVRPNYFFQNDATYRGPIENGVYPSPLGDAGITAVDVRDIAEAAAIALTTDGHSGKIYNVNGPERVSGPSAAAAWSETLDKPVSYGGHDMDAFEKSMRDAGAPAWSAFDMRTMFSGYLERGFAAGAGDFETLTTLLGHAPRRYADFVRETVARWAAP